jgi:predicted kinase
MPTMNIMVGNIGSGKSLVARKWAFAGFAGAAVFNMDAFQEMISGGQYGAYDITKKDVYQAAENTTIEECLKRGISVVIDRTNMDSKRRARFIEIGKKYGATITCYNFGAGDERNLINREKSCRGVPMATWKTVFESMQKAYEPPTIEEGFDLIVDAPKKYRFYAFDFDGTIVSNKFPEIGEILDGTVKRMNDLYYDLENIIIIWTSRSGEHERLMRAFLIKNKIPFDFINENPIFNTGGRKIFAHEYYDDRNVVWPG